MTTKTRYAVLTTCDRCGLDIEMSPTNARWFLFKNGEINMDICLRCGHEIHSDFNKLKIQHKFICYEYSDTPNQGLIEIE